MCIRDSTRAAQHAGLSMNEFLNSKFYKKTHMYSYPVLMVFLVVGVILLVAPFVTVVTAQNSLGIGFILAVIFVAWPMGLYFFVQSAIGFQSMKKYMH